MNKQTNLPISYTGWLVSNRYQHSTPKGCRKHLWRKKINKIYIFLFFNKYILFSFPKNGVSKFPLLSEGRAPINLTESCKCACMDITPSVIVFSGNSLLPSFYTMQCYISKQDFKPRATFTIAKGTLMQLLLTYKFSRLEVRQHLLT